MKQNYFIYNGKRYNAGTIIKIKGFDHISCKSYEQEATFISYNPDNNRYQFRIKACTHSYPKEMFDKVFLGVKDKVDTQYIRQSQEEYNRWHRKPTFEEEMNINGLFVAWIWYITIMLVLVIFNGRIFGWIGASIIFFDYRKRKIREAGYKI